MCSKLHVFLSQRPKVVPRDVQRFTGHVMHLFLLRRPMMSIMRALYAFVEKTPGFGRRLPAEAARECKHIAALLPLCKANLRLPWSPTVTCSDACLSGIAVCRAQCEVSDISQVGAVSERWRYTVKLPSAKPREPLRLDPFSDPSTVRPMAPADSSGPEKSTISAPWQA